MNYCPKHRSTWDMLSNFLIGGPNQSHNVNFKEPLSEEKEGQTNLFTSASSIPFLKIFQNPKSKRTSNLSLLHLTLPCAVSKGVRTMETHLLPSSFFWKKSLRSEKRDTHYP
jgi:hypothetical protein